MKLSGNFILAKMLPTGNLENATVNTEILNDLILINNDWYLLLYIGDSPTDQNYTGEKTSDISFPQTFSPNCYMQLC